MKHPYPKILLPSLLFLGMGLGSCSDEALWDRNVSGPSEDSMTFLPSIGLPTGPKAGSRAGSADAPLEPLLLQESGTRLYLHTYVAERSQDPVKGAYCGSSTRGAQVNDVAALRDVHGSFGVRASFKESGETFLGNSEAQLLSVSGNAATWKVRGGAVHWPADNELTFHAWAPATLPSEVSSFSASGNVISFDYTTPRSASGKADAEAQPDLMFAAADCSKPLATQGSVPLTFRHALSAVKFALRDVVGGTVVSLSLHNVMGEGSCLYTGLVSDEGWLSADGSFSWSGQKNPTSFSQDFGFKTEDSGPCPGEEADVVINDAMPSKTFMMIPQSIPDNAEIEVVFRRDVVPAGEPAEVVMRGRIKDNLVEEWLPGKEYVYSISTSSANWTYVFDVKGSYRNGTEIYMPCPADEGIWGEYYQGGGSKHPYYSVVSYRYRSNNPSVSEPLPWTASHGDGEQWFYNSHYPSFSAKDKVLFANRPKTASPRGSVAAASWLKDAGGLKGEGGIEPDVRPLDFLETGVITDWSGDQEMYAKEPYSGNSQANPWDLARFGKKNGKLNTANCYVVDRGGWYAIPLYYGNSMTDGVENPGSYTSSQADYTASGQTYVGLRAFLNHLGKPITSARIPDSYVGSAHILWQDAFNLVDNVSLATINGEKMLVFHVNRENIQQGNAVVGIVEGSTLNTSSPKVVWSWHIWVNEHWLNDQGLPNAFSSSGFDKTVHPVSQMKKQGDVALTVPRTQTSTKKFTIAPYNVGWCDAKRVLYQARSSVMQFKQFKPGGALATGRTASLDIVQDGETIEYKYGNNVYFQFGRKDPIVGFLDHENQVKDNFGALPYLVKPQRKTIAYSIQNPHVLIAGGEGVVTNNDWNKESSWSSQYYEFNNLWNNYGFNPTTVDFKLENSQFFNFRKTVYDPSPAGYVVPPVGVFKVVYKAYQSNYFVVSSQLTANSFKSSLNGKKVNDFQFNVFSSTTSQADYFTLTSTGHRWYASNLVGGGSNFNPNLVYLWSSSTTWVHKEFSAFSIALGNDFGDNQTATDSKWILSAAFSGRKSMARPVRPIRESNTVKTP